MMQQTKMDGYFLYKNENGVTIGTANNKIKSKEGLVFRNLSGEKELLPYEDFRLDATTRAKDLASRLSIEQIAGLMLYSSHQSVPADKDTPFPGVYGGKPFEESGCQNWELSDEQKYFLEKDGVRHVLLMRMKNTEDVAKWNNELQKRAEGLPFGIPVNLSTDPRHGAKAGDAEFQVSGNDVSKWPEGIGMAALFSPKTCERFAQIASKEYRALGICTALGPQIDLATEPRWMRFSGTFGMDKEMSIAMTKAYCDGLQTTKGRQNGWGEESVAAMVKHWPGGGTGEGGRDAHYAFGAYAIYPGDNFEAHKEVFTKGAFALDGPTKCAASVMPYYTVSWKQDKKNHEEVGNAYSEYIIKDLLRGEHGYDGVVCTDWGIMEDPDDKIDSFGSRCFNQEMLTEEQRYLKVILNGVDQFGGINKSTSIIKAYELGCNKYGEEFMRSRMEESAVRLLINSFRCGLFENPYLDAKESLQVVGAKEYVQEGYRAQLDSVVLLKNANQCLPIQKRCKVYIPNRKIKETKNFFRRVEPEKTIVPVDKALVSEYFELVSTAGEADVAIVFIESPITDAYKEEENGNGYYPISLQYRPYTAKTAREESIAGGDFREDFINRSYKNKTSITANEQDLDNILQTKQLMGEKPVIVSLSMKNPTILSELELYADAILVDFGVQNRVIFDLITGSAIPNGLLPLQIPKDMDTVEKHMEDVAFDLEPYSDSNGNVYDYGFGMNFEQRIMDERTSRIGLTNKQ